MIETLFVGRALTAARVIGVLAAISVSSCLSQEFFEDHSQFVWDSAALAPYGADYTNRTLDALSSKVRRDGERRADVYRMTAAVIGFSGADRGQKTAELVAGDGFFTRVLSAVVGREGQVTAWQPRELIALNPGWSAPSLRSMRNVRFERSSTTGLHLPTGLDLVFSANGYHELHLPGLPPAAAATVNAEVFRALKPGGAYVIVDYHAASGTGTSEVDRLHRIEAEYVRREVLAAGFVLDDEDHPVYRASTPLTTNGHQDQPLGQARNFMFRFRKPG